MARMRRTGWMVTSAEDTYDATDHVHAVYEYRPDAEALANRLRIELGPRHYVTVDPIPVYAPGDRSYRRGNTWSCGVDVPITAPHTMSSGSVVENRGTYVDDDGPADVDAEHPPITYHFAPTPGVISVIAQTTRRRTAVELAQWAATIVQQRLADGDDPRDIVTPDPNPERVQLARDLADVEAAHRDHTSAVRAWLAAEQKWIEDRNHQMRARKILMWKTSVVALHTEDGKRRGPWVRLIAGHVPTPKGWDNHRDIHRHMLRRKKDGAILDLTIRQATTFTGLPVIYWDIPPEVAESVKGDTPDG